MLNIVVHEIGLHLRDKRLDFRILGPVGKDLNNGPFAEAVGASVRLAAVMPGVSKCPNMDV